MKKNDLSKSSLNEVKEELISWDDSEYLHFRYNSRSGLVLFQRDKFSSAQDTILAKCVHCQIVEHKAKVIGNCPNVDCPLYRFMSRKRYSGKDKIVYPS